MARTDTSSVATRNAFAFAFVTKPTRLLRNRVFLQAR